MVGFTIKKVDSLTLGEKLKKIREESNVSLSEISKGTRVRKVYLEMLEQGQFEKLPPDVYVRGFLKSYARYLGIEPSDVIRLYEKERGIHKNIKKSKQPLKRKKKFQIPSLTITPNVFAFIFFIALVLLGFGYFYKEVGKFSQQPRLVVIQPSDNLSIEGNTINIVGISEKDSKVSINDQPIFVNEKGEFNENISLQDGVNELEVKTVNRFGNESTKKITVSANSNQHTASGEFDEKVMGAQDAQDQTESELVKLEIKIKESPTWISVEVDGNIAQSGTMLPGSVQLFEAQEQISITSGKANKTIVTLNGRLIGPLGETAGVVREVVFTKETKIAPEGFPADQMTDNDETNKTNQENNQQQ